MVRPRVFFDISIGDSPIGRVIFELFNDTAPKTCENFRALCTGEKGLSPLSDRPLYYKNSIIHRSIKDFMIQGGDITKRNGMGGESIYGGSFPDEDLTRPLDAPGLLCMANKGPNTNGSQFFITLRECPHLNGKHVVFGRAIRGYDDVVAKIADVPVEEKDRPTVPVTISNCGELMLRVKVQSQEPEPAKASAASGSESEGESASQERRKHKKRRHHRSESQDSDDRARRHHRKGKSQHKKPRSKSPLSDRRSAEGEKGPPPPEEETEEQYDARLEREEKERLEEERIRELERLKKKLEETQTKNGVRFKGRGRMKFIDPELHRGHRDD
ncbi:Peptidyl-prolyl cis-trans isomerase cyp11 [Sparassis crispa]|uniref:Peptidyl-prolyl cis-trans isomerase D n=1 Tax=Sparassis crispa TaxID=139825 RepID=A0A401H1Y3_9APHY|nr:Peptidyl-prolyl cis-trans isomerase cyp11 [Sparassis crispa]GBE88441.1 Peptidyl-prolyl cis-trans isomerase cyp11 [Sparassis crispa]